jgi:uncharacterized protein
MGRGRWIGILVGLMVLAGAGAAQAKTQTGYLKMADGSQIKYTADIPSGTGPFPVVFTFDGYAAGVSGGLAAPISGVPSELVAHGYVALGANAPGTGCSTGTFDFFSPTWAQDGARIVEWAAHQPWSDGKVAMIGHSFSGFASYFVAAQRPPNLVALAPASTSGDFYRDAVYPGGIYNAGIAAAFVAGQQENATEGVAQATAGGDTQCAVNFATHLPSYLVNSTAVTTEQHPYFDSFWQLRTPDEYFPKIDVPVLATDSWQDGIAGGAGLLDELPDFTGNHGRTWFIGGNGNHDEIDPPVSQLFSFLDHYVKGVNNGWQKTPHIQLWQDDQLPGGAKSIPPPSAGANVLPEWSVNFQHLPLPVTPLTLHLRAGDALSTQPATTGDSTDSYAYPTASASALNETSALNLDDQTWTLPFEAAGAVAYTTAPFARGAVLAGPGSLNLWMSSTATDTDLQATITEELPNGQEMYVQRGWLRVEDRKLDAALSTPFAPYYDFQASDVQPLVADQPTYLRLEIPPFSVAIRPGARLRLIIDTPSPTGVHIFTFLPTPSTNTVYHDPSRPSTLVLGLLAGVKIGGQLPPCDEDIAMPCRSDAFAGEPVSHDPIAIPNSGCPLATGALLGPRLGLVALGITRARARTAYVSSSRRGARYEDTFCLTPSGVRVGYASPALLGTLPRRSRAKLRGRVIWATTSNPFYALHGVRQGATVAAARRRLRLSAPFRAGPSVWYLAPNGDSMGLLKVRQGIVAEVGIADRPLLTRGRAALAFVRRLS